MTLLLIGLSPALAARELLVAAAADLRPAMEALVALQRARDPGQTIRVSYGSTGKFTTQIRHAAPYDLFFAADERFVQMLHDEGLAAGAPRRYARGRLVLWLRGSGPPPELAQLAEPTIRHIAIAHPEHAPYGQRAMQVLQRSGLLGAVEARLVRAENIGQAAHFAHSGAADAALLAVALVQDGRLASGRHVLIDESLHDPLWQAAIITRHGAGFAPAAALLDLALEEAGRSILADVGFALP